MKTIYAWKTLLSTDNLLSLFSLPLPAVYVCCLEILIVVLSHLWEQLIITEALESSQAPAASGPTATSKIFGKHLTIIQFIQQLVEFKQQLTYKLKVILLNSTG